VLKGTSTDSQRRPWMASVIWGWRLELLLSGGSLVVLAISSRIVSLGPLLITAVTLMTLRSHPDIRKRLASQMQTNREHRSLHAAFWHCAIVGRNGTTPKIVRSADLPVGRRYLVSLPIGLHFELMKKSAPELAAALGAREVRMKPYSHNARYVEIAVIRSNAFPSSFASPMITRDEVSLWEPLLLALTPFSRHGLSGFLKSRGG